METIMNKTTLRNVEASVEVREFKDELSEAELKTVSGGKVKPGKLSFEHYYDSASILLP
jgi:bacteriocin-like protein